MDLPNRSGPDDDAPRGPGIGPGGDGNANGGGPPPGQSYRIVDPVGVVAPAAGLFDGLDGLAGLGGLGGLIFHFLFGA